jgi:hypothetical protein
MKTRAFSLAVKWKGQTVWPLSCLEPSLKISGAIPPLNLSASMVHIGTTVFYLYHLPMYISLKRSHPLWSCKEPLYTSLTPYIHTTWPNYFIFIDPITLTLWTVPIKKPHYIIFCVLLLLNPSVCHIFSW